MKEAYSSETSVDLKEKIWRYFPAKETLQRATATNSLNRIEKLGLVKTKGILYEVGSQV
jgi:hypothetical protein